MSRSSPGKLSKCSGGSRFGITPRCFEGSGFRLEMGVLRGFRALPGRLGLLCKDCRLTWLCLSSLACCKCGDSGP